MNYPKITSISKIKRENNNTKTLMFNYSQETHPGQFFMIWIAGVDEIPMSASYINGYIKGITFRRVGEATHALFKLKEGDHIGIRGPYGKGFKINGKKILFVGGGTGIATLAPAVEMATMKHIDSTVIIGAKTTNEIFFEERLINSNATVYIATNDGSKGYKGFASDLAQEFLGKDDFSSVITCGPELMMKKLLDLSKNIPFQASIERYMKCGFGICGQCCIGDGLRVCEEGPVFEGKMLKHVDEFGVYRRNGAGRKIFF